ncbi:MAG: 4Fe-4S ferredoxin [Actinomycetota bacterium]|nr:4Fe-4S ferredoxin [Actinomycetota bacterium]
MPSAIIIGSGPSAASVAICLADQADWKITVLDVGLDLEPDHRDARDRLSTLPRERWARRDVLDISARPVATSVSGLPEKRAYGSDYPFRDSGQLSPIAVEQGVNDALISGAYGGFSAVWGAQLLPFPDEAFESWPLSAAELAPHYRAVLTAIPFAAADDDLATVLPLHAPPLDPMPLSPRAAAVEGRYRRHRVALNKKGLVLGRSRLAVRSDGCIACGMCMTGCPYSLIYSAAQTFDDFRSRNRVEYHCGMLAVGLSEGVGGATVIARETGSSTERSFTADRVFVACGAVGTTRLVLGSLRRYGQDVALQESAQFVLPFVSFRSTGDPRSQPAHALGQLSGVIQLPDDESQLHLQMYTYDPTFLDALPRPLRGKLAGPLLPSVLSRLSVGLGYLPSSASPRLRIRLNAPTSGSQRAPLVVTRDATSPDPRRLLRPLSRRLLTFAPLLDLWPVLPRLQLSAPGKSYHWGGTFPHAASSSSDLTTDRLGRLPAWRRIHLVDAAVIPSFASTSFTLTVMANAHRIATESLELSEGVR